MTVREWLYRRLTTHGPLRDVVGDRVYPGFSGTRPVKPYVTFFRVSNGKVRSLSGDSGTKYPRYQIDVWAGSQDVADEVEDLIHDAVNDVSGAEDDIHIQWAWVDDARDDFDDPVGGDQVPLYRNSLDVMIWHNN